MYVCRDFGPRFPRIPRPSGCVVFCLRTLRSTGGSGFEKRQRITLIKIDCFDFGLDSLLAAAAFSCTCWVQD